MTVGLCHGPVRSVCDGAGLAGRRRSCLAQRGHWSGTERESEIERERARDGLAVVHWRHRPLSWRECGGCAPAFEALPPTNSGLPISTHCVDTPTRLALPPSPYLCFPYKARPGHFLSGLVRFSGHCVW